MSSLIFVYLLVLLNICSSQIKEEPKCSIIDTCDACIRESGCFWCNYENAMYLSKFRPCMDVGQLETQKTLCTEIINPQVKAKVLKNDTLSTGKDAVQISPQKVRINLRVGEEYKLEFKYAQAADYPVDLYYVMDLSGSMRDYRDHLSALGVKLAETMKKLTKNFRLGFGSFIDKSIYPFADYSLSNPCVGPNCDYVFKNHLSLSDKPDIFSQEVANAKIYSGGGDEAEDGLDALLQAIVCQKVIGWREKARHLLVFTTDESYHLAGDGKFAGIVIPHDGKCYMENNSYTHGLSLDFPTIGLINAKASEHGVNIIFAITEDNYKDYIPLQEQIKNSFIKILQVNAANVIELIQEFYGQIVDSVQIFDDSDNNVEVKYYSNCTDGVFRERNQCDNLHVGVQVNFTAVIKVLKCPKNGRKTKTIFIRPSGLKEALEVETETICGCDCDKPGSKFFKANASECSNQGDMKCGICDCFPNKLGSRCECDPNERNFAAGSNNCRPDNGTQICSGSGSCRCNECVCQKRNNAGERIYGKYCECNNFSCRRHLGKLCSGESRGTCVCGKCNCLAGYTGDSCECPIAKTSCISPVNNKICSGKGKCYCGACICEKEEFPGQFGKYCDECSSCKGSRCAEFQHCVECTMYGTGLYQKEDCAKQCTEYKIEPIYAIDEENLDPEEKFCMSIDAAECYYKFKYSYTEDKSIKIYAEKFRICSETNVLAIVFIIIGSILLGGLILLIVWKSVTSFHDRKEYAKFEEDKRTAEWNSNYNPLFKNATTSFVNPTYSENLS